MEERLDMDIPSIAEINHKAFQNVEGWVGPRVFQILEFFQNWQKEKNVTGDIAEIGIHHGMFFFIISGMADHTSKCFAVDIFENQQINIDNSGQGSRLIFESNAKLHFPFFIDRIKIIQRDSLSISPYEALQIFGNKIKVISVDGGHTVAHVVNDLNIAQEITLPYGIVILDDFFGPHWPSVTEGFFRYMNYFNRRLAPVLIFQNKMFLTTYSEHRSTFEQILVYVKEHFPAESHSKWRIAELCAFKVLCHSE